MWKVMKILKKNNATYREIWLFIWHAKLSQGMDILYLYKAIHIILENIKPSVLL